MLLSSTRTLTAAALLFFAAGVSSAQGVKLEFVDGRVHLSAQNVPARVILAEWARLGGTTIVGGDRIVGGPISIELTGVTEREALDVLLREVPGYMLAARQQPVAGRSRFDRIMVVPVTAVPPRAAAAPAFSATPPPAFNNQNDDAAADRAEQDAARRADELRAREDALRRAQDATRVVNPAVTAQPTAQPAAPPPFETNTPRPVAPPPTTPGNPFMPTTGSATPGTIAPVPQQQPQNQPRPVQ